MTRSLLFFWFLLCGCSAAAPARDSHTGASVAETGRNPNRARAPDGPVYEDLTDRPRVALVVGNGAYSEVAPLDNAARDARHIAARLAQLGFDVELVIDADRVTLLNAIAHMGQRLEAAARDQLPPVGLFYFLGHGMQYQRRNYVVPVRAGVSEIGDIPARLVEVNHVLDALRAAANPFKIVVLDASRDNAYANDSPSMQGLLSMVAPRGTLLAYAASPGRIARDGEPGEMGIYTQAFLRHIARPGIPVATALDAVATEVEERTNGKQTPWRSSTVEAEFAFNPCPDTAPFNGVSCGAARVECDRGAWDGERCVLELLECPRGFEMVPDQGCRPE
ncbi:MAG TPA: caspase family protein [Polyangiaceae bacterium]